MFLPNSNMQSLIQIDANRPLIHKQVDDRFGLSLGNFDKKVLAIFDRFKRENKILSPNQVLSNRTITNKIVREPSSIKATLIDYATFYIFREIFCQPTLSEIIGNDDQVSGNDLSKVACFFYNQKKILNRGTDLINQYVILELIESKLAQLFKLKNDEPVEFYWIIRAYRVLSRTNKIFEENPYYISKKTIIKAAKQVISEIDRMAPEEVTPLAIDTMVAALEILKRANCKVIPDDTFMRKLNLYSFESDPSKERLKKCASFQKYLLEMRKPCAPQALPGSKSNDHISDYKKRVETIKIKLAELFKEDSDSIDLIWISRADKVLNAASTEADSTNINILESSIKVINQIKEEDKEITMEYLEALSAAINFFSYEDIEVPDNLRGFVNSLLFVKDFDMMDHQKQQAILDNLKNPI